jgi:hypothetical protein
LSQRDQQCLAVLLYLEAQSPLAKRQPSRNSAIRKYIQMSSGILLFSGHIPILETQNPPCARAALPEIADAKKVCMTNYVSDIVSDTSITRRDAGCKLTSKMLARAYTIVFASTYIIPNHSLEKSNE